MADWLHLSAEVIREITAAIFLVAVLVAVVLTVCYLIPMEYGEDDDSDDSDSDNQIPPNTPSFP